MTKTSDIVQKLWGLCHVLRDDGITYHQYVTELTLLLFLKMAKETGKEDVRDRILFIQAIETVRCVEEGVLTSVADANIGSIFGIGFAAWTGGALQFINQYGVKDFVARAQYLAEQYGERFLPPALLLEKAAKGEAF